MTRLFDVLEEPIKGYPDWYLREMKHHQPVGTDTFVWRVELANKASGVSVVHEHEDLIVAWARAVEAAYASATRLFHDDDEPAATPPTEKEIAAAAANALHYPG